jgi:hypothetical protein
MNLIKCPSGHFYDSNAHDECPYCGVQSLDLEMETTQAHTENAPDTDKKEAAAKEPLNMDFDSGKTMGMYQPAAGAHSGGAKAMVDWSEPVVGWLVCIEGECKGRDFRLHSEKNFVGRDESNDVVISEDTKVSRKNHATVSFNPKRNTFKIYPGDSRGIVYLNDEEVSSVQELNKSDVIELGETKLVFIPFCGPEFGWEV